MMMAWTTFIATFWAIFFAELADKTQLVGMAMTSRSGKPLVVWIGSVAAYMLVTILSVFMGAVLGKYLTQDMIRYAGSVIFIVIGILMFIGKI